MKKKRTTKTAEQAQQLVDDFFNWTKQVQDVALDKQVDKTLKERMAQRNMLLFRLMRSGEWYTLEEVHKLTGYPSATASAGIRDFRKDRYGSNIVELNYLGGGVYQYRLILNQDNNILIKLYGEKDEQ